MCQTQRRIEIFRTPIIICSLQVSSTYQEIAVARLDQDKKIMSGLNAELIRTLNESFIKVNELRKSVRNQRRI